MTAHDTKPHAGPIHEWIVNHDDSRLFIVAYIGLAVVLSAFVSLFWLLVVVGVHFCLELIRQRHVGDPGASAWKRSLWELRLDLALIVFAMVIALYMEFAIGVAGLRLAPRLGRAVTAGSRGATRFAAWSRVLRAVFLSLDDALQVLRAAVLGRRRKVRAEMVDTPREDAQPCPHTHPVPQPEHSSRRWSWGDILLGAFFAASVALLVLTPVFTDHSLRSALDTLLTEMHPWP